MPKQPTSFRLSDMTTRQLTELISVTGLTQSEVMAHAIERMHREEIKSMPTELTTAQAIYREIYGDIDNKFFKAEKIAEIETWLEEGDPAYDLAALVAEWREFDAEEIARRNV